MYANEYIKLGQMKYSFIYLSGFSYSNLCCILLNITCQCIYRHMLYTMYVQCIYRHFKILKKVILYDTANSRKNAFKENNAYNLNIFPNKHILRSFLIKSDKYINETKQKNLNQIENKKQKNITIS